MSREIARIRQVGGGVRVVLAQDDRHARHARRLMREDPSRIDRLDGMDGIRIETRDEVRS